jgi:hypothetical protein
LLHVLVAGYSLAFQQMLRSIQTGQPVRGALRAATQALVLPALLLLEVCESTAASFRRLLVEQVAGAAPLRVPRYVATGQVLRRYDRLESLGRALLYHTPGPFLAEEFLGCAELQLGLYAVVTVGHLLLLGCSVSPAAATAAGLGPGAGSSAAAAAGSGAVPAPQQQQQQQGAVHVQYKRPELLLVLDVRDVMMVAVEGSSVRLLCMAGDHPGHAVASSMAAATAAAAWESESAAGGSSDDLDMEDEYGGSAAAPRRAKAVASAAEQDAAAAGGAGESAAAAAAAAAEGDAGAGAGLRELVLATQQQELGAAGDAAVGSVGVGSTEEQASSGVGSSRNRLSSRLVSSRMVGLAAQAAAPGVADVAAAAAAAGAAAAASGSSTVELLGGQGTAGADDGLGFGGLGFAGGGKWFVGHTVPCGSEAAARQLQQLLQQACQRLDSLIASSAWQRQLLL